MPYFNDINFKYTDAKNEKLYTPNVLRDAFVDVQSCISQVLMPDKYIIYGSKGSGKTALASYYELKATAEPTLFSRVDDLEDFDLSLVLEGNSAGNVPRLSSTINTWKYLLTLRLFALLAEDEGLCQQNSELVQLKLELDRHGLLPTPTLTKLANSTVGLNTEIGFKFFIDASAKVGSDKQQILKTPYQIAEGLLTLIKRLKVADGKYVLFVDGLDHMLRGGDEGLYAVSDLINAVRGINELLQTTALKAKIVTLLRSELVRAIPNPDLSKRLSDNGIFMEWYFNTKEPLRSDLMRVIQHRARLVGFIGTIGKFWWTWMPDEVYGRDSARYIINRTRFLPRDIIRFFYYLQKVGNIPFNSNDIIAAEHRYSLWFFDELYDSLAGLLDERVRSSLSSIITQLGTYFKIKELEVCLEERGLSSLISAEELARLLFETHWIGNVRVSAENKNYNIFKSRNRSAGFSRDLGCTLSWGLIKGMSSNKREDQQKNRIKDPLTNDV